MTNVITAYQPHASLIMNIRNGEETDAVVKCFYLVDGHTRPPIHVMGPECSGPLRELTTLRLSVLNAPPCNCLVRIAGAERCLV